MTSEVTLALPSKGAIAEPTYNFLRDAGLRIQKPNPRQYTGTLPAIPSVGVLFQRVKDVVYKVSDGTAQLGIAGLDEVEENPHDELIVIHSALGYGHCEVVVAVPETWVDVETMADILDIAEEFRTNKQRNLRIATTFTHLARRFFHASGIHHFKIVPAAGAIEAAPTIGYADIVVDITQTGTTLRENHLKIVPDGIITKSQACLIGNKRALRENKACLDAVQIMLERIDASLDAKDYSQLTVNIQGKDEAQIGRMVTQFESTKGLLGPTIAPIFTDSGKWYSVTVAIKTAEILEAVQHLRTIGASQIVVTPIDYIYQQESPSFASLLKQLDC